MKKSLLAIIGTAFLVLPFFSCDKIKDLASVNLDLNNEEATVTIPVITAPGAYESISEEIYINVDSMIRSKNASLSANLIKEVRITSCQLSLVNGDANNNFGALSAAKLSMVSNTQATPVVVGQISDNPDASSYNLSFPVNSSLELKSYFTNANRFKFTFSGTARRATTKELKCTVKVKYTLKVGA